jgi:hypothetical protein
VVRELNKTKQNTQQSLLHSISLAFTKILPLALQKFQLKIRQKLFITDLPLIHNGRNTKLMDHVINQNITDRHLKEILNEAGKLRLKCNTKSCWTSNTVLAPDQSAILFSIQTQGTYGSDREYTRNPGNI